MNIYLDVDSVVADFNEQCRKIFPNFPDGPVTQRTVSHLGLTDKEFWDIIDSYGEQFWVDIPEFPWTQELIEIVKYFDKNFVFLTAPSLSHFAASGKVLWFQNRFGKRFEQYIICPRKHKKRLAYTKDDVLIDDYERTCLEFSVNGTGILFPTHANKNIQYADDPVSFIKKELIKLC